LKNRSKNGIWRRDRKEKSIEAKFLKEAEKNTCVEIDILGNIGRCGN